MKPPGFEVTGAIDRGPRTSVYRALRTADGAPVVLKHLSAAAPSARDLGRYRFAYRLMRDIDSPGLSRTYALLEYEGRPLLVTEDIGGQSIRHLMKAAKLELVQSLAIASGLADALTQLHGQGIVHRDVNPSNVIVADGWQRVQLIDFDLSSRLAVTTAAIQSPSSLEGTLPYIAPEQTGRMNRSVDHRSDLYAFGVSLYEMVTGELPFAVASPMALVHAHIAVPPPRPNTEPAVAELILKLLAKNPEDRYQSAAGLKADLERCLASARAGEPLPAFELATHDRSAELRMSQHLYGREKEITSLVEAFERAQTGGVEMLLVAGYSGVGKSSLVHEIYKPVTAARGRMASGKFDQLAKTPYGAVAEVVAELVRTVLTEPDEEIDRVREAVGTALGAEAGALAEVAPQLALLIGDVAPPGVLPALEAQHRLQSVFQRFLHAFARAEAPLVVFLDDLQWADPASLTLLQHMVQDPQGTHILLLGAYRDNEVDEGHAVARMVAALETVSPVTTLTLKPLRRGSVARWLADSLGRPLEEAAVLAAAVQGKTGGNPFFVDRLVRALADDEVLRFDHQTGHWTWDLERLSAFAVTDNVAELLTGRVARLGGETRAAVEVAACVGNRFRLVTLAEALDQDPEEVAEALWPALGVGLLDPIGDDYRLVGLVEGSAEGVVYRFTHDRVQEAAYAGIPEDRRAATHLGIGRRWLAQAANPVAPEALFGIVDQMDAGREGITDDAERDQLAALNLQAAERAWASVAFEAARRYFSAGVELAGVAGWDHHYDTMLALVRGLALANERCGDDAASLALIGEALSHLRSDEDRVRLLMIQVEQHMRTGAHLDALVVGFDALRLLGHEIPEGDEAWAARGVLEAEKLATALAGRAPLELLALPRVSDERAHLSADLLAHLSPGVWTRPQTITSINPWLVRTFIESGHTDMAPLAYAGYAMALAAFGQHEAADGYVALAGELADRQGDRASWPAIGFVKLGWVEHWMHPLQDAIDSGRRSIAAAVDTGAGASWAAWSAMVLPGLHFAGATELSEAMAETLRNQRIAERSFNVVDAVTSAWGALLCGRRLLGEEEQVAAQRAAGHDYAAVHARLEHYPGLRGPIYSWRQLTEYILGDLDAARAVTEEAQQYVLLGPGLISATEWRFFGALIKLATRDRVDAETRAADDAFIAEHLPMLDRWAELNPPVHGAKPRLIRALQANADEAPALFGQAIAAAERGSDRDLALCLEAAGRFWRDQGLPRHGHGYLVDARFAWVRWGATAKVRALEVEFPFLQSQTDASRSLTTRSGTSSVSGLDAHTLLQSTRAISTTLELDDLLETLLQTVIENAGAQRASLLLPMKGELEVATSAAIPGVSSDGIAWSILRYAARTQERVVLGDASANARYAQDEYIARTQPRSTLCQPIVRQGELVAVLYLENNLTTDAFTPAHCEVLDVLSAQAAISIANARLFAEQRALSTSMGRFLPVEFLRHLGRESVVDVQLGDASDVEMTVLFSDIRGFTSRSEGMTPAEIFGYLNGYLRHAGPVIRRNGGFIDKYIGDEIMALFPGEPDGAIRAAVELMEAVRTYNVELSAQGAEPMAVGVGVHRGRLMLGTIGEPERMDSTVLSDTVNVAARLQNMTKEFGAPVIISEAVVAAATPAVVELRRSLGHAQLRGRQEPLPIYQLLVDEGGEQLARQLSTRADFEAGIRAVSTGEVAAAAAAFVRVLAADPEDKTAWKCLDSTRKG